MSQDQENGVSLTEFRRKKLPPEMDDEMLITTSELIRALKLFFDQNNFVISPKSLSDRVILSATLDDRYALLLSLELFKLP